MTHHRESIVTERCTSSPSGSSLRCTLLWVSLLCVCAALVWLQLQLSLYAVIQEEFAKLCGCICQMVLSKKIAVNVDPFAELIRSHDSLKVSELPVM